MSSDTRRHSGDARRRAVLLAALACLFVPVRLPLARTPDQLTARLNTVLMSVFAAGVFVSAAFTSFTSSLSSGPWRRRFGSHCTVESR